MTRVLEVADTHDQAFLHMSEILDAVQPEAAELHWAILDLGDAFAPEGSDFDVLAIESQVEQSPSGLRMSFAELVQLANRLQQVIDGLFVAVSDAASFPRRDDTDEAILEQADIVLAAFDSSFWLISAPDAVLERVAARFVEVRAIDAPEVTLSAWGR